MTDDEIKQVLAPLPIHVGKELTFKQIRYWHEMLNDLPFEVARQAIIVTLRDYQYAGFPPVGLVRKNAGATQGQALSSSDRARIAFAAVKSAVAKYGGYATVIFDDPIVTAAIRHLGGWVRICDTESGEKFDTWLWQDFERVYNALLKTGIRAIEAEPLPGICETENGERGRLAVESIPINLPKISEKLIRGEIREPKRLVALPEESREFVESLGRDDLIGQSEGIPIDREDRQAAVEAHQFDKAVIARQLQEKAAAMEQSGKVIAIHDPSEKPFRGS